MRKIIVLSFISLDGVMQAPGGPNEDISGSFNFGGWSVPYWDDTLAEVMEEQMGRPFDLLLGRKTYDIFAASWPLMDPSNPINSTNKYVLTTHPLPEETEVWRNSYRLNGDIVSQIRGLKTEEGADIQVHGSSELIQTLLRHDLVDELWLKIYPVTLGRGKRLFGDGTQAKSFKLSSSRVSSRGVIIASYIRDGEVQTSSF